MTPVTPGQAGYEARRAAKGRRLGVTDDEIVRVTGHPWDDLPAGQQADEEAGAQAAIAAQEPCPSPELGADSDLVALAAACSHRDVLAAALARIEGLTSGYDPGTKEYDVHEIAAGALSFRAVTVTPGQAALQPGEIVYLYHWRFASGEEFGLYRHAEDAEAKAAEHVSEGLSEVLSMAVLDRPQVVAAQEPHAAAELAALADTWQAKYREYADASMENAAEPDYARAQRAIGVAYKKCAEQLRTAVSAPAPPTGPAPEMAAAALRQAASADEKERAK